LKFSVLELAYLSLVFANSCAHGINRLLVRELLWFEGFKDAPNAITEESYYVPFLA
jgi:hypothetical protein